MSQPLVHNDPLPLAGSIHPALSLKKKSAPKRVPSMLKTKELRGLAWLAAAVSMASLTGCDKAVVLSPAGDVAAQQGQMVITATVLMLIIIVPVIAAHAAVCLEIPPVATPKPSTTPTGTTPPRWSW
jgi:cadmium resistance protein CadD (predicted permease)